MVFLKERREHYETGNIKTFPLRGIKDSPPYLHDGRLLTLEDTIEFFNLILAQIERAGEEGSLGVHANIVAKSKCGGPCIPRALLFYQPHLWSFSLVVSGINVM